MWVYQTLLTSLLKDASLALFQISNVYLTWGSLSISKVLGWIFLTMSIYFSLAFSRAFSYAAHSNFWCRNLELCSLGFLKMLVLALSLFQFTHVYFFLFVGVFLFRQCLGINI